MSCIQKEVNNEKLSFEIIDNPTIEDLKCCICLELADNPQVTIECNHFFCKTCIEQYFGHESLKDCPLCKTRISRSGLKHFFLVETLISKFNVKCSQQNCIDIFPINNIDNHINNQCQYYEKNCKFNCGLKIVKKDIIQHENCCLNNPKVEINCNKCNEKIFAINLQKHLQETCLEEVILCKFGCREEILRKNIKEHYKELAEKHAEHMYKMALHYQNMSMGLIKTREKKQENINKLKTHINTLLVPYGGEAYGVCERIHTGFGNYDYFVRTCNYNSIITRIKIHVEKL